MENNVTRDYSEFKKLDRRVREVAYRYRYARAKLNALEQSAKKDAYWFSEPIEPTKDSLRHEKTVFAVDNALTFLQPVYKEMIEKDYLIADNDFWWVHFYSRSTYYRTKRKAMTEFLSYFE